MTSNPFQVLLSLDETVTEEDLNDLLYVFGSNQTAVSQAISSPSS